MGEYLKNFSKAIQDVDGTDFSTVLPTFATFKDVKGVRIVSPSRPKVSKLRVLYFVSPDDVSVLTPLFTRNFSVLCSTRNSLRKFAFFDNTLPALAALIYSGEWCLVYVTNKKQFDTFPQYESFSDRSPSYISRKKDQKNEHVMWKTGNWLAVAMADSWKYLRSDENIDESAIWLMGQSGGAYMCSSLIFHWDEVFENTNPKPRLDHVFLFSGASMACFGMGFLKNKNMVENLISNPYKSELPENLPTAASDYSIKYYTDRIKNAENDYYYVCPQNFSERGGRASKSHPNVYIGGHKLDKETRTPSGEHFMHQYFGGLHADVQRGSHAVECKRKASWRRRVLGLKRCPVPKKPAIYHRAQSVHAANLLEILHCRAHGISSNECNLSVEPRITAWWVILLIVIACVFGVGCISYIIWMLR